MGLFVNMPKSYIYALGFSTGHSVAADSITLDGLFFTALLPDQEHKHLGVRMTMTGIFEVEKEFVRGEMQRRLRLGWNLSTPTRYSHLLLKNWPSK